MRASEADDEADLGLLARQTLSGVEVNDVPPEPFALGVDLEKLATTSRPPAPPRTAEDTDGRIDLRASSPGVIGAPAAPNAARPLAAPPANGAAALAARLRAQRGVAAAPSRPPPIARAIEPQPVEARPRSTDRELDDLIASRSLSAVAALEASATRLLALARSAPSWTWALAGGVTLGLLLGLSLSGRDDEQPAPASADSTPLPAASAGAPVLPRAVAAPHSALPTLATSAARGRALASADRGPRRAASHAGNEPQEPVVAALAPKPAPGEPRSIDTLLDQAIGGGASPQALPAATRAGGTDASRPTLPERSEVARLLAEALPRVRFCAGGRSGVAKAQIVVKSSGRVGSVQILGAPFSRTTAARCMETAIRGVQFPPFSQASFRITYPYAL